MATVIRIEDKDYSIDDLSDTGQFRLALYKFADQRLRELSDMQAVLQRARNSYLEAIKREVLAKKAGLTFDLE